MKKIVVCGGDGHIFLLNFVLQCDMFEDETCSIIIDKMDSEKY